MYGAVFPKFKLELDISEDVESTLNTLTAISHRIQSQTGDSEITAFVTRDKNTVGRAVINYDRGDEPHVDISLNRDVPLTIMGKMVAMHGTLNDKPYIVVVGYNNPVLLPNEIIRKYTHGTAEITVSELDHDAAVRIKKNRTTAKAIKAIKGCKVLGRFTYDGKKLRPF